MNTILDLAPGLTDKQLECLHILMDGEWHDQNEIGRKLRIFISANISGRIVRPLKEWRVPQETGQDYIGIVEQEERPVKEGSKKKKKVVRIKKDVDPYRLHELIFQSALFMIHKYRTQLEPKRKMNRGVTKEAFAIYSKMYHQSAKELRKLEKIDEARQQREEEEFWKERLNKDVSEQWQELVKLDKQVYDALKSGCKKCCETHGGREEDCYPLRRPGVSFLIASLMNPRLISEILQQERNEAISISEADGTK